MASTYTPIATTTLGTAASTVSFSSIPSTYTDLVLVCNPITNVTTGQITIRLNGDTGTNYSRLILWGNGTSAGSAAYANENYAYSGYYTTLWTSPTTNIFNILNYSNASTNKTILGRSNNASEATIASANLWRGTAAVSSIELGISVAGTYSVGSMFTLYGIKAA
jgi:hypothetical protein